MAGLNKTIIVVAVVVIIAIAGAAAFFLLNKNSDPSEPAVLTGADLKVLGNADGDHDLDGDDIKEIQKIIDAKGTVTQYPLADANNDKVIDSKDIDAVKAIVNYKSGQPQVPVWHVNFHDDGKGVMALEIVETMYPLTSVIATGSANGLMMLQLMDIVDEVKGACYSSSSADKALYNTTFLDTEKCVNLGSNTGSISFEDGKAGSSDVIKEKNVTALITDWNKTYITNEADFEKGGVDVVRIAAAGVTKETYTHTILLLGFLFQKEDRAEDLLELYEECGKMIAKYKQDGSLKGMASSMASATYAYVSSIDSDYTEVILAAGFSFGLPGIDFGGKTTYNTYSNLEIYNTDLYHWDYTVHIRTNMNYSGTIDEETLKIYTDAFCKYWEYTEGKHQYLVSGVIPVPLRVLYVESIFNEDLDASKVDELHQKFVKNFYIKSDLDISKMTFFVDGTTLYD